MYEFHTTGRISEDSNKAYNGTLAATKSLLIQISITNTSVQTITRRANGNLKGIILDKKLASRKKIHGKRRISYNTRVTGLNGRYGVLGEVRCVQFKGK